jgi:hypothetical protein
LILRGLEYRSELSDNVTDDSPFAQEASVPLVSEDLVATGAESELVARNVEKMDDAHIDASNAARPPNEASPPLQVV